MLDSVLTNKINRDDENIILYEFLRTEIQREDRITQERLVSTFAFQGFLIAGTTLLLAGNWIFPETNAANAQSLKILNDFRVMVLGGAGLIGLFVAIGGLIGIYASRKSINTTRAKWENLVENGRVTLDDRLPQAYGQGSHFTLGGLFPYWITWSFVALWLAYLVAYFTTIIEIRVAI